MQINKYGKVTVEIKDGEPHAEIGNFETDFNGSDKTIADLQKTAIRWAIENLEKIEADL
jgi:lipoate synthase